MPCCPCVHVGKAAMYFSAWMNGLLFQCESEVLAPLMCCHLAMQGADSAEQQGLPVNWRRTTVNALVQVCPLQLKHARDFSIASMTCSQH